MPDPEQPGWLRTWVATLVVNGTVYGPLGLATGGLLLLVALGRGWDNPWSYFFAGTCITPGFVSFAYTTDFFFERRLRKLKFWHDEGLISQALFDQHRKIAMEWRSSRPYGDLPKASARRPK